MKMNKRSILLTGILFGAAANTIMQTVVATILPQVVSQLGSSHLYGWVFSGYLLMSTITIPLFAKLADLYGYKLFFTIGMTVFLVGSLLCGLAPSLHFLVMARLVQGVGAGVLGPVSIALISVLFPVENRGKALSAFAAVQFFSNLAGPIAGGFVASSFGWPFAFYMVIPLGLLSLITIRFSRARTDREPEPPSSLKNIDYWGALLLGGSIALFVQAWTIFEKSGWSLNTLLFLAGSLLLLIWFVFQEDKHPAPVLPPDLIKITNVKLANWSALLTGVLMHGAIAILPLYAATTFNGGSADSARFLLPLVLGLSVGIIFSGQMIHRFPYKMLARTGWLIAAGSLAFMSVIIFTGLPVYFNYLFAFLIGFGIGSLVPTFLLPAQNAVSERSQATIGGMIQLSRNIGGAAGIPLLTSIIGFSSAWGSKLTSYGIVFLVLFILGITGFFIGSRFEGAARPEEKQE
ncbi:MFS transporter [Thermoactinomyces mirandus]|nr:MFS transporter [Thermoactinomyces mirandus]